VLLPVLVQPASRNSIMIPAHAFMLAFILTVP
jgi:hypothetical protein